MLREQLVKEVGAAAGEYKRRPYNRTIKDEVSDSLDSNTMSIDYPYSLDDSASAYMNGDNNSNNWSLPIETVIVEDDNNYKETTYDDEDVELETHSLQKSSMNFGKDSSLRAYPGVGGSTGSLAPCHNTG